jgi:hypothetical protein
MSTDRVNDLEREVARIAVMLSIYEDIPIGIVESQP